MLKRILQHFGYAIFLFGLASGSLVQAATYVNQTRLIIDENTRDVTFSVINEGTSPTLMQLWSDRDNLLDRPEIIKMPFVITPPVFRLEAGKSRAVRIQWTGDSSSLAKESESLFWLNILEVPPKSANPTDANVLQMAFRTRIKLLYRPSAIAKVTLLEGVKQLETATIPCAGKTCLRLKSRSPLHITLLNITLNNGMQINVLPHDGIIAPFSTLDIPLPDPQRSGQLQAATWIDDYGVANHFTK
ncbi:molecular chaperone [Kluyvera genomosp. 1]|uniref:fimbrial biogenesis chaperone n=1 Tax=Kluyvera genomosp. 1 TaxID=2774053 RepID=UPI0006913BF6|nr:molecular chaperone [Kluyvera genomosp. 1]